LRRDASEGSVYGVSDTGQSIATFTISEQPLVYYNTRLWKHPEHRAVYVSHLAVLPKFQGRGIGKWCMKTIEEMAHGWGCETVRLDAYEKYEKLLEFYDDLGYERREVISYKDLRLVCFEKIINDLKSNH
jgi:GNAT superfamily N-acetyltransferase